MRDKNDKKKYMVTNLEIHRIYSILSFEEFWATVVAKRKFGDERKQSLLKKGNYKKLREELYPLYEYVKHKYNSESIQFYLEKDYHEFDATITNHGSVIEQVEFTYPRNGVWEIEDAKYILNRGYSEIRDWGSISQEKASELIIETAKKKSIKNYEGKTLVFIINQYPLWDISDEDDKNEIVNIARKLKIITYSAKNVCILVMPLRTNSGLVEGEIIEIK
jgi:hypothetical protein